MNTAAPAPNEEPEAARCPGHWYIPHVELRLADGTFLVKPQKPVRRATANQVSKWTGMSKKCLKNLAESGFITRCRPNPSTVFYYPGEVQAHIRQTEADPDFWTPERLRRYQIRKGES